MKILIAPDKFKHTLTAQQVANTIEKALFAVFPDAEIYKLPSADGGEGTSEVIASKLNVEKIKVKTHNPIFEEKESSYYFSEKIKTAFIDLSASSGLQLLKEKDRNPLYTSTFGTGELIIDAVKKSAETIYIATGGSATNDCACGAAEAVGFKFYDKNNKQIKKITGKKLIEIAKIDKSSVKIDFKKIKIIALHDVKNPLYGKNGAAYVYAGQKGANTEEIKQLDKGLKNIAETVRNQFDINIKDCDGCGAAGGFGAGSKFFFNADLKPGAETVLQLSGFNNLIKDVDFIITGEGKFDNQSFNGKLTGTIINEANKRHIPVIVICGINEIGDSISKQYKNLKIVSLYDKFPGEKKAKEEAEKKISRVILNSNFKLFV